MERNWLIRTKSNHIFGPVSRDKILELLKNDTLKPRDELCQGNGFWFFVEEKELFQKYITDSESMPFNPVTEAKEIDVSAYLSSLSSSSKEEFEEGDSQYPAGEDLDYPDMGDHSSSQVESTIVSSLDDLTSESEESGEGDTQLPPEEDLEYPE